MTYTKNTWTDEDLAGPERYDIKTNAGAAIESNVQIELITAVTTAGTAVDAAKMNNIEEGIEALDLLLSSMRAAATELTIATDAITVTQSNHKLQPQSGTADNLSTINGTTAGQSGVLYCTDYGTDTITIKHNVGNILCMGAADISLSQGCVFWYSDGTKVFISGGGSVGGSFTWPSTALTYPARDDRLLIYDLSATTDKYIEAQNFTKFGPMVGAQTTLSSSTDITLADTYAALLNITPFANINVISPPYANESHLFFARNNSATYTITLKDSDGTTTIGTLAPKEAKILAPLQGWKVFTDTAEDGSITLAKMATLAANSIIGNNTGSAATPIALTATQVKTLLGLTIGTDVQAYHARLADLAGITYVQGDTLYFNGTNIVKLSPGTSGQFLKTQGAGANPVWATIPGGGDLLAANNLSDLASAATARTNLGLAIGTNVQAYDAELAALAGLTSAADSFPYFTGSGTASLLSIVSAIRTLLASADVATFRSNAGLAIGTNVQAYDAELAAIAGLTSAADSAPYFTGSGTAALMTVTSAARTVLDDTTTAAMLTTLGALPVAGGTLTGEVDLGENAGLVFDVALSADGKYTGLVRAGTAGATLAFGDLCYLSSVDSRWELVDANAESTSGGLLGMCVLAAAADGSATKMLMLGFIRADAAFPALTIGGKVFASTTAGDVQTTAPSGAADIIRVVGYADTADSFYFNPSADYYEHA